MARRPLSALGSHRTRFSLCPWPARASGGPGFATVTLLARQTRVAGFSLEARNPHHPWGPCRTRVAPHSWLPVLPIQSFQAGWALYSRRPWRPHWPWHPRGAAHPFAALLGCRPWRPGRSGFPWETRRPGWPWEAWLPLKALISFFPRVALSTALSSRTRWPRRTWDAIGTRGARFPFLSRGSQVASFSLDAVQPGGAHCTRVSGLTGRAQFPFRAGEPRWSALALETRQSGCARRSRKTWRASRSSGPWRSSHPWWALFPPLSR